MMVNPSVDRIQGNQLARVSSGGSLNSHNVQIGSHYMDALPHYHSLEAVPMGHRIPGVD